MELNTFAETSEIKFNEGYGWYISTTLDPRIYLLRSGKVNFGCGKKGYFKKKSHAKFFLRGWIGALKAPTLNDYTEWKDKNSR